MRRAAGALLLAAMLLAGCGGSGGSSNGPGSSATGLASESADQIVAAAEAAATHASAVEVAGSIAMRGQPVTLDLTVVGRGKAKGTVGLDGKSVGLIRIGDRVFIKGSKAYYTKFANAEAATLFAGRWIAGSAESPGFSDLAKATKILTVSSLFKRLSHHGTLTKGTVATIDGTKAIAITDNSDGSKLFVSLAGKPYPLEIESPDAGAQGTVTFTHWNEPVLVTAPKGAIDMSKLSGA